MKQNKTFSAFKLASVLLVVLTAAMAYPTPTHAATMAKAKTSADNLMDNAAAAIDTAPALDIDFTILGETPMKSKLLIAKAAFAMTSPLVNVWFDGKTQWTFLKESGEVNITEPTAAELMESNPFSIIRYYATKYKARRLENRNGCERVELTPLETNRSASIRRAILSFTTGTYLPAAADITFTNGSVLRASVEKCTRVKKQPLSAFRYDSKKHPAKEIIDLR